MAESVDFGSIVRALVEYLRANPHACDAPDGVARWWLTATEDAVAMKDVMAALDWLLTQGVVEALVGGDGRRRYRRSCSDAALNAALSRLAALH